MGFVMEQPEISVKRVVADRFISQLPHCHGTRNHWPFSRIGSLLSFPVFYHVGDWDVQLLVTKLSSTRLSPAESKLIDSLFPST